MSKNETLPNRLLQQYLEAFISPTSIVILHFGLLVFGLMALGYWYYYIDYWGTACLYSVKELKIEKVGITCHRRKKNDVK